MALPCPDCGADMILKTGRYGEFFSCSTFPACRGTHSARNGKPVGIPANAETRAARHRVMKLIEMARFHGNTISQITTILGMPSHQKEGDPRRASIGVGSLDLDTCLFLEALYERELHPEGMVTMWECLEDEEN